MITQKSTNAGTHISICNWRTYQIENSDANQQLTNVQPTANQQLTTEEEGKKVRRKEKTLQGSKKNPSKVEEVLQMAEDRSEAFRASWEKWVLFRGKKEQPVSVAAAERLLRKYPPGSEEAFDGAVEQSIEADWQKLVPVRPAAGATQAKRRYQP